MRNRETTSGSPEFPDSRLRATRYNTPLTRPLKLCDAPTHHLLLLISNPSKTQPRPTPYRDLNQARRDYERTAISDGVEAEGEQINKVIMDRAPLEDTVTLIS